MTTLNDFHNARILIVDDCRDTASSLTELLAVGGYQHVSWTTDGEAVCQLHASDHYDLFLLDLHMPGVSGLEVMERLRMDDPGCHLSIIVMTGDECCRREALEAGACDYIMKPFEFPEFETRIRKVLALAQARECCRVEQGGTGQSSLPLSKPALEHGRSSAHSTAA